MPSTFLTFCQQATPATQAEASTMPKISDRNAIMHTTIAWLDMFVRADHNPTILVVPNWQVTCKEYSEAAFRGVARGGRKALALCVRPVRPVQMPSFLPTMEARDGQSHDNGGFSQQSVRYDDPNKGVRVNGCRKAT